MYMESSPPNIPGDIALLSGPSLKIGCKFTQLNNSYRQYECPPFQHQSVCNSGTSCMVQTWENLMSTLRRKIHCGILFGVDMGHKEDIGYRLR